MQTDLTATPAPPTPKIFKTSMFLGTTGLALNSGTFSNVGGLGASHAFELTGNLCQPDSTTSGTSNFKNLNNARIGNLDMTNTGDNMLESLEEIGAF
jgi:hypothetical protein